MACAQLAAVNPFIGSGGLAYGYGGLNPGAQVPFGVLRLGPDTTDTVIDLTYRHFSGYNYQDKLIRGFSHTHLVGAGINNLGNFGLMPVRWGGMVNDVRNHAWWSPFQKSSEESKFPGHYGVFLDDPNVQVDLLAVSTHTAVHRYSWKAAAEADSARYFPSILFDACHAAKIEEVGEDKMCHSASISIDSDLQSISGAVLFNEGFWVYIHATFNVISEASDEAQAGARPRANSIKRWLTCDNGDEKLSCRSDLTSASSNNNVLASLASFAPVDAASTFTVEVHVGISFQSIEQAKTNLQVAIPAGSSFDSLAPSTQEAWCSELAKLEVTPVDGDEDLEEILTTAHYHTLTTPTIYTEEGGQYLGLDQQLHNAAAERAAQYPSSKTSSPKAMQFYSDLSLWDTFRSLHPWLLLKDEPLAVGILRSVSEMTQQQQGYPKWVLANKDISCMVGLHGAALAVEGALAGLGAEFDLKGIQAMLVNQFTTPWPVNGRTDLDNYLSKGFVSIEGNDRGAPMTVTYAYDDFLLQQLSLLVGDTMNAESAGNRSKNYRNVWNADGEYICSRHTSGEFECPKSPTGPEAWQQNIEGDALHWSLFVQHDPQGLMALWPSRDAFVKHMQDFFEMHVPFHEKFGSAVPNPYYWAGNEVDFFAPSLFAFAGDCKDLHYWTRRLTKMHFSATAHGIPGNDDYGSQSSWLLLTSLGIYPQAGTSNFIISSPRVSSASVSLTHIDGSVSTLQIKTVQNSAENVYVEKLLVNGEPHTSPFIDRSVLAAPGGCILEFHMSSSPTTFC